jgi:uncharacterized membrane protein
MRTMPIDVIGSRWIHVTCACLLVGGMFFFRFVLPRGLRTLDEEQAKGVMLAVRRGFKMVVHTAILLLLLSGIYNSWLSWDKYNLDKAVLHALWGTHILFATLAITLSFVALAGREPGKSRWKLLALNFVILLLAVAAASSLKWAKERAVAAHQPMVQVIEHP